jgi:hypothetical protein
VQFFRQSSGLSVHIEMSEHKRPVRTVTEAAVVLTAAEKQAYAVPPPLVILSGALAE